jgi:putative hydrolase of the HAD superfamily
MTHYHHLFFDLDCTLWDFKTNSGEALFEIYETYQLQPIFGEFDHFRNAFVKHNEGVWKDYREGKIHKDKLRIQRFERALKDYEVTNFELAQQLNEDFIAISPAKAKLIPGTIEVLEYLKRKRYLMYIITNGFLNIQQIKIQASGIDRYFLKVFTPEIIGQIKPHRAIFEYAVKTVNARKAQSLMIGDELETDIIGAHNFGMDQVFFNPGSIKHSEKVTYEISNLLELKDLL